MRYLLALALVILLTGCEKDKLLSTHVSGRLLNSHTNDIIPDDSVYIDFYTGHPCGYAPLFPCGSELVKTVRTQGGRYAASFDIPEGTAFLRAYRYNPKGYLDILNIDRIEITPGEVQVRDLIEPLNTIVHWHFVDKDIYKNKDYIHLYSTNGNSITLDIDPSSLNTYDAYQKVDSGIKYLQRIYVVQQNGSFKALEIQLQIPQNDTLLVNLDI